jgi:hypothetical protein
MMKFSKLIIAITFLFSVSAKAGFLVEPYLGYSFGSESYDLTNSGVLNGKYEFSHNGYRAGARLGYQFLGFMGGIDYGIGSYGRSVDSLPSGVTTTAEDESFNQFGIFAGYELPILFRFWATYYVSANWEGDNTKDEDSGSGFGLGAGFTGLPFVSLNLEYKSFTIDETKDGADGSVTKYPTSTTSEPSVSEIVLSVSLPLDF